MNDISANHIENCKRIFDGYKWGFTTFDVVNTQTPDLILSWKVPSAKRLLLYTNPPFGTTSTGRLVSRKDEMNGKISRKQSAIQNGQKYPAVLEKYGKGDLFLPIVGRLIEIAKTHKKCCVASFSPFGLFCGRKRYVKLLTALLRDFKFLKGYVFAGNYFHDINKTLPVAFSIWEYAPNTNAKLLDLNFEFVDKSGNNRNIRFKRMGLLKDGWRYRDGNKYVKHKTRGAIGVPRCESFNDPSPKIFGEDAKEGSGAELSPDNLKLDKIVLKIPNMPSELVYALWSVSVGLGAFRTSLSNPTHPIYMRGAYVHLPDFHRKETLEIMAYSALHALIKNYAEDKIGFFGTNKVFRFGNERLTNGVEYLFNLCKDSPVYDGYTIREVFGQIRQSKVDVTKCRRWMKDEVSKRLNEIGYWDYVPIP